MASRAARSLVCPLDLWSTARSQLPPTPPTTPTPTAPARAGISVSVGGSIGGIPVTRPVTPAPASGCRLSAKGQKRHCEQECQKDQSTHCAFSSSEYPLLRECHLGMRPALPKTLEKPSQETRLPTPSGNGGRPRQVGFSCAHRAVGGISTVSILDLACVGSRKLPKPSGPYIPLVARGSAAPAHRREALSLQGIYPEIPGWDPATSHRIAEVELA
jgi:hypothetical protein